MSDVAVTMAGGGAGALAAGQSPAGIIVIAISFEGSCDTPFCRVHFVRYKFLHQSLVIFTQ